jgi:hypothetical protein
MMIEMPIADTAVRGMRATGIGATSIGATVTPITSATADRMGRARTHPRRFPWGLLRLAICVGNAAVWISACEALDAGIAATVFAGFIGFATVAMVFGITMGAENAGESK